MKRKICVVTGSRAEYGVLYHTLKHIDESKDLELLLVATGMHLSKEFGYTVDEIIKDDFLISDRIEILMSSDTTVGIGKSIGIGVIGFTDCLKRLSPDIMLIVGDRYEIFAAATAAMSINLPIAHISGGEITEFAIDEQIRHAITKMSHIHFVALEENAERVKQMGEEAWRVHVVGGPWVDNIKHMKKISKNNLKKILKINFSHPTILVTYHPVTLQASETGLHIKNLLDALAMIDAEIIFTYPNADAGGGIIISAIETFVKSCPKAKAFKSLGSLLYLNLLSHVDLVVGNSSSGVVETQIFKLPVVNIGERQKGRLVTENIICTNTEKTSISKGIRNGLSKEFKREISNMENPYHQGGAAEKIVTVLSSIDLGPGLLRKKFIFREVYNEEN